MSKSATRTRLKTCVGFGLAIVAGGSAEAQLPPLVLKTCGVSTTWRADDPGPFPIAGYRRLKGADLARTVSGHVLVIRKRTDECISDLPSKEWYRPDGRMEEDPGFWGHAMAQGRPPKRVRYELRSDDLCVGRGRGRYCRSIYTDDHGGYLQVEPNARVSLISPIFIKTREEAEPW
jgi:hypothetical protein